MHPDHRQYYRFTTKASIDKAINSLLGIIESMAIDRSIDAKEVAYLRQWVHDCQETRHLHPFDELISVVEPVLTEGVLSEEQHRDLTWLCNALRSTEYYDLITADMQRLHGIMRGILADGIVTEAEVRALADWLQEHDHLRTCWPYDEIDSVVSSALSDGRVDQQEQVLLREFLADFCHGGGDTCTPRAGCVAPSSIVGICASCPSIIFRNTLFCFTGTSRKFTRAQFTDAILRCGGKVANTVTRSLNYLVVCADGNPCWAYACYGRKVEEAVALRKTGAPLQIVHENDVHDAMTDSARTSGA